MEDFPSLEILLTAILSFIVSFVVLRKGKDYDINATRINRIHDYYPDILNKINEIKKINTDHIDELSEDQQLEIIQNERKIYEHILIQYRLVNTLLDEKYQKRIDEKVNKGQEMNRELFESIGTERGKLLFNEIRQFRMDTQTEFAKVINEQLQDFYRVRWFMRW